MLLRFVLLLFGLGQINSLSNPFDCKVPGLPAKLYLVKVNEIIEITDASSFRRGSNVTTYFMVHGWGDDSIGIQRNISQALAAKGNSILVDYGPLANEFYISCAAKIVVTLGNYLSDFIVNATNQSFMHPHNTYLIGQSLGAHVIGYIGRTVYNRTKQQIKRLSGLDPAGPLFGRLNTDESLLKLNKNDAFFVDILHSSFIGLDEHLGTVDVSARGFLGTHLQKACILSLSPVCSHGISKIYFLESINNCGMIAKRDDGVEVVYGFHMPLTTRGIFEINPNWKSPFSNGNQSCS